MFQSDARQDQFVANMLKFKKNGHYIDIGSCHSMYSNNSFYFQSLDWKGICVEINSEYNSSYESRKDCIYLNEDATKIEYRTLLNENNFPKTIDYLSLDIDEASIDVLKILPLDEFRFRVITIEHDAYHLGDYYRSQQRQILEQNGYMLVCSNVFVQQNGWIKENCAFEDWWIDPNEFDEKLVNQIKSESAYPSEIIENLRRFQ
jgi:hypothetical protein